MSLRAPGRSFCGAKARAGPQERARPQSSLVRPRPVSPLRSVCLSFPSASFKFPAYSFPVLEQKGTSELLQLGARARAGPRTLLPSVAAQGALLPPAPRALAGVFGN